MMYNEVKKEKKKSFGFLSEIPLCHTTFYPIALWVFKALVSTLSHLILASALWSQQVLSYYSLFTNEAVQALQGLVACSPLQNSQVSA